MPLTDEQIHTTIRSIKADFRAAMNGVAAAHIRQSGMGYKLTFGVELPRLRDIAAQYEPDARLAQALWDDPVRECRILATMLYPPQSFYEEIADVWAGNLCMEQAELAQLLAMNVLCHTSYAVDKAFCWMASELPVQQLLGFLLITRVIMQGTLLNERSQQELHDQAEAALHSPYISLRKAAQNALAHMEQQGRLSNP